MENDLEKAPSVNAYFLNVWMFPPSWMDRVAIINVTVLIVEPRKYCTPVRRRKFDSSIRAARISEEWNFHRRAGAQHSGVQQSTASTVVAM